MLTFETSVLEKGTVKATINANDLVKTAITLKSLDSVSNGPGYSVLLMQTGLEEAAKASFLFEKFIRTLRKGRINISKKEWRLWMGSSRSHSKRIARVQYLYALAEQVGSMPGGAIMFPQGVKETLQNRNAALYVDFDHKEQEFISPSEAVDASFLTANSGFAKHLLHFTSYDKLIEMINSVILDDPSKTNWFVKSIEREINRKQKDVWIEVDKCAKQSSFERSKLNKKPEVVFCARPRPDGGFGLIYSCTLGTEDNSIFIMDNQTNHFAIHPDGRVIHARYARTVKTSLGFKHEWEVIGSR